MSYKSKYPIDTARYQVLVMANPDGPEILRRCVFSEKCDSLPEAKETAAFNIHGNQEALIYREEGERWSPVCRRRSGEKWRKFSNKPSN